MKRLHTGVLLAAALLLASSIIGGAMWLYAAKKTVPDGVTAAGLPLGGLQVEAALSMLDTYTKALEQRSVIITGGTDAQETLSLKLSSLGLETDATAAKRTLIALQEGSLWQRVQTRWQFSRQLKIEFKWDRALFNKAIRGKWGYMERNEPVAAQRVITANDQVVYSPHQNAVRVNYDALYNTVQTWAAMGTSVLQTAHRSDHPTETVNSSALLKQLQIPDKLSVKLPLLTVKPAVTLESLKAEGIERLIASFTTDYSASRAGRAYNVEATAVTLNDWQLLPDEVFDYNKIIHLTEERTEYREAPVILSGKLSTGLGGGICQVSSTLYNAVLLAGLDIVERMHHSLPVSYLPIGQDATYAEGVINFRFRNTTGHHLLIRTETKDGKLTVKLFGTMSEQIQYKVQSSIMETLDPGIKEEYDPSQPIGTRKLLTKGKPGYIVYTYRTQIVNGKEQARELISKDTYLAQPRVISIGGNRPKNEVEIESPQASLDNWSGHFTSNNGEPLLEDGVRSSGS